jgi:phosphoglycolate phosphatase
MIKHVVWDWNGTLLDDVSHALIALNHVLSQRGIAPLDRDGYRERFGFPVRDFYVGLGVDPAVEDFALLAEHFIARYRDAAKLARTHDGVTHTMQTLRELGIAQSVLSAMEHTLLRGMLHEHGLIDYLHHVRGLDHLQASSKVQLGVALMDTLRELGTSAAETLFVGDTLHDLETAEAMGCRCLLYVHGHQSKARLAREAGSRATLIHSLDEVLRVVRRT